MIAVQSEYYAIIAGFCLYIYLCIPTNMQTSTSCTLQDVEVQNALRSESSLWCVVRTAILPGEVNAVLAFAFGLAVVVLG